MHCILEATETLHIVPSEQAELVNTLGVHRKSYSVKRTEICEPWENIWSLHLYLNNISMYKI